MGLGDNSGTSAYLRRRPTNETETMNQTRAGLRPLLAAALLALASAPLLAVTPGEIQTGIASYYHDSLHGNRTASGQIYDKNKISAAHKRLPLGSKVKVTDTKTGRSIVVHINDRGPFIKGRIIDLSRRAAHELGIIKRGITPVKVEILSVPGRGA
jgi:rare lipoprotein A